MTVRCDAHHFVIKEMEGTLPEQRNTGAPLKAMPQELHHSQPPVEAAPPARRNRSALAFGGFALLIALDMALAGSFNPDRGTAEFWIKLVVIFEGLLAWSLWIARRLSRGKGVVA